MIDAHDTKQNEGKPQDLIVLGLFVATLVACVILSMPILVALLIGLALFAGYALWQCRMPRRVAGMCWDGIRTVGKILIMFLFIGGLTAAWRTSGTIPTIVYYATPLITPQLLVLSTFLLCCLVSVLTGTAFGTSATMGCIALSVAASMQAPLAPVGGAALAGAYFGDRWSPVSTSALLVSTLTNTDLYSNLKRMAKTAAVPFVVSCTAFALMGWIFPCSGATEATTALLAQEFNLSPLTLLPAASILLLAALRVNVIVNIATSIVIALPICVLVQGADPVSLVQTLVVGFSPQSEGLSMLAGGGVVSMLNAAGVVCVASAYAGIFKATDMLRSIQGLAETLAAKSTVFAATAFTAVATALVACNQTLSIMLTHQICGNLQSNHEETALDLYDSAVVVAPLVPWAIANTVPLSAIGAPLESTLFAVFLYLLPLWRILTSLKKHP